MKYIRRYLQSILCSFHWYRRKQGGTWYKVIDPFQAGMQGTMRYWTQDPQDMEVVKEETY